MHTFLTSIGFHELNKKKVLQLIQSVSVNPDRVMHALDTEGNEFAEIRKDVAPGMGIAVRGYFDDRDEFHMDYYFPYSESMEISTDVSVELVKESDKESFLGLCDELRLGVDLIFFVQDMFEVLTSEQRNKKIIDFKEVRLSGLCSEGMILLPIKRDAIQLERAKNVETHRAKLISDARDGDTEAMEELTLMDMDLYNSISQRIESEDVYSIVNTYFMPNGVECDKYSIMGEILGYRRVQNKITFENVYILSLVCNNVLFEATVAAKDLIGEPKIGRRFKGKLWMQGRVTPIS